MQRFRITYEDGHSISVIAPDAEAAQRHAAHPSVNQKIKNKPESGSHGAVEAVDSEKD